MSEHEERPYSGMEEEQAEERLQEPSEERTEEEDKGVMPQNRSAAAEALGEKIPEHQEEKEKVKRTQKKKKASKSRRKEQEYSIDNIGKQLEKQTNYLAKLEQVLQPLQKLAKRSDIQSKLIKNMNTSVKQMERQIIQIQKAIQKGKTSKK
ncbi:MAG: hypothetical protein WA667_00520 [Candidatus Nitrosopolaris sp.]